MKRVKIFLASSIEDLKTEKMHLGDFFGFLNEQYLDKGIRFSLIQCDSQTDPSKTGEEQLAVYDAEIKDSDISLFIFFKRVGDNTKHQFETALQHYENTGKPYILTTIKRIGGQENPSEEVNSFMEMLDKELKHFYHFYSSIDQLKLWLFMQIMVLKLDTTQLSTDGDLITFNGQKVADINNIPAFTGDNELMQMKQKYKDICIQYNSLRQLMKEDPDDDTWEKYSKIAAEKSDLEKEIKEKSISLLSLLQKITDDTAEGKLTDRLRENYRLIELGDYDGALEAVNLEEIKSDISFNSTIADRMVENLETNARELYARIDTLEKKGVTEETAREIRDIYYIIVDLCKKYRVGIQFMLYFSIFLADQNNFQEAVEIAELFQFYCSDVKDLDSAEKSAALFDHLGSMYVKMQNLNEAEKCYLQALNTRRRLVMINTSYYEADLAFTFCNLGRLYSKLRRIEEAEKAYLQALEIQKRKVRSNSSDSEQFLAYTLNDVYPMSRTKK